VQGTGKEKKSEKKRGAFAKLADRTTVVLVGTMYGGNLGSVARVMHNFGFGRLRLAEARTEIDEDARKMAMYSDDILERAVFYETLAEAVADADVVIGTTRRLGRRRGRRFDPPEMSEALRGLDLSKKIALVFGPEDAGLSNEHLDLCHWLVTIGAGSSFDSLNLSHAVAVILYEIHRGFYPGAPERTGESQFQDALLERFERTLHSIGFIEGDGDPKRVMIALRRMIGRGNWSRGEIKLFHAILNKIEKK
jgi:tRNA/rRNA methyltransferase